MSTKKSKKSTKDELAEKGNATPAHDTTPTQAPVPENLYPVVKHAGGRPEEYTQYIASIVCGRLTEGESLRSICRDETMPSTFSIYRWMARHPEFSTQYARAIQNRVETHVEEMLEISDDGTNDWVEKQREDGSTYIVGDHEHIQRSRLRVETRKWIASKLKPKKYGEKIVNEVTGPGGGPVQIEARNSMVESLWNLLNKKAAELPAEPQQIESEKEKKK